MTQLVRLTRSEAETEALGAEIARRVRAPLVLLLDGELGAGKTAFVRGFVQALPGGDAVVVQSPTFALARSYRTLPPVHHLDLYRLEGARGLEELGLAELLDDAAAFSLVEWPGALAPASPFGRVRLRLVDAAPEQRSVEIELPDATNA
ncbi:MAG: tRNA (adenosine(37)-N6)-threonylcarbamoyltransferase complex ATPase subunit type 1 TsaE [Deltaproteobacteria bacterium]|nr:tRNA (adenosine(37)-N6)-threonylcarbamoyltransferase complex ATPase subunit type 1 TsaE [Deltaproteobacteria bacterium]